VQDYTEFCINRDKFLFFYSLIIWLLESVTLNQSTFDYNLSSTQQSLPSGQEISLLVEDAVISQQSIILEKSVSFITLYTYTCTGYNIMW